MARSRQVGWTKCGLALALWAFPLLVPVADQVTLRSRMAEDKSSRTVMVEVQAISGQVVDEVRLELPRNSAENAALLLAPKGWKLERDGHSVRLSGPESSAPLRFSVLVFDVGSFERVNTRVRRQGRDLFSGQLNVSEVARPAKLSTTTGLLELPALLSPGETIEMKVLDPKRTPPDGQWVIAGASGTGMEPDRVRVQLPDELRPGQPLRVSYFDSWGEISVDALSVQDVTVSAKAPLPTANPRINGCARYAFLGQSVCVCGDFPESTWSHIKLDGQPAQLTSASRHVLRVALPDSLTPGRHTISGDSTAGFSEQDKAEVQALRLRGSIDSNALLRGQSTTMRLGVEGTSERMKLTVTNRSPGVVSLPGGNHQELETSGGAINGVERPVDAVSRGNFIIDYSLDAARCPCEENSPEDLSTASQAAPPFVPRRVLATVSAGSPAATYAAAQAVASENGMAVLDISLLALTNEALLTFEILDGVPVMTKVAALGGDSRLKLVQPDAIYVAAQGTSAPSNLRYGPRLIGADLVQSISRGEGVKIAVVDTGIDNGAVNLKSVSEYLDVTGTGWTPDAHGTLVAGVIAGEPGGVSPAANVVGVKSCVAESPLRAAAVCWSSTLARGIDSAAQKNARVINLSVGGPQDALLSRMVDSAQKRGIILVSAAGNDGPSGKPSYPAAFKGVLAVTAVDMQEHIYANATQGSYVSLSAPGVDIVSVGPGGRTQIFSGTSAATPFVSGAVALLLKERPNLSPLELRTVLQQTARRLGPAAPNSIFGYGVIDVCRAMAQVSTKQPSCR